MSHAEGAIRFLSDGHIMFYEYNGTSDVVTSHLRDTMKEVYDNWRKYSWLECSCGNSEPVEIWTRYGHGFSWNGKACRSCKAITEGFEPTPPYMFEGTSASDNEPEWLRRLSKDVTP